eukprot:CAMPEP_0184337534 /NCGR_PEP_ID=MMETSP1089-20130417/5941_1 /TAXON_ID=38269 ORGANISM="Gloeochaete wittrockiana, Strain SAG46.84" /NCGR_SAMPLE_ID=MMETSP1089 /ASSEMBLY_ACC=CAM_ASM_000445 /LENGTH=463 /DNA_ID=CAMNT_0026663347 /DNA_START=257 /DNA_END=1648 /DNA_ORIENTATION=+
MYVGSKFILSESHHTITSSTVHRVVQKLYGLSHPATHVSQSALREIIRSNDNTDLHTHTARLHVDGETFNEAQDSLLESRNLAKAHALEGKYRLSREHLGRALHILQDFYAHSNYVEGAAQCDSPLDIHPTWGRWGPMFHAAPDDITCTDTCGVRGLAPCQPVECDDPMNPRSYTWLTSGYFPDEDVMKTRPGKCDHGGPMAEDFGWGLEGLNKDAALSSLSTHAHLHMMAAEYAVRASELFLYDLWREIKDEHFRGMIGLESLAGSGSAYISRHIQKTERVVVIGSDLVDLDGPALSMYWEGLGEGCVGYVVDPEGLSLPLSGGRLHIDMPKVGQYRSFSNCSSYVQMALLQPPVGAVVPGLTDGLPATLLFRAYTRMVNGTLGVYATHFLFHTFNLFAQRHLRQWVRARILSCQAAMRALARMRLFFPHTVRRVLEGASTLALVSLEYSLWETTTSDAVSR